MASDTPVPEALRRLREGRIAVPHKCPGVAEANRRRRGVWVPPPKSDATRKRLSEAQRGKLAPAVAEANRNRIWTAEQRAHMSEQSRNRPAEYRSRQAAALRGRTQPIEQRRARRRAISEELDACIGDNQALRDRVLRRLRKYGNTVDECMRFVSAAERGICDLCGNPETRKQKGVLTPLSFDHDHKTGRYRGALCACCNLMLDHGRDSADLLRRGADFLERAQ